MFEQDDILETFRAQSEENLAALEEALLSLESRPGDRTLVQAMFRVVHTVKGDAVSLGFDAVGELAHAVEDALELVRSHEQTLTRSTATLLLRGVDSLREMIAAAAAGEQTGPAPKGLLQKLRRLSEKTPASTDALDAESAPAHRTLEQRAARTLRVNLDTLDELLTLTGEIAIARGRLQQVLESDSPEKAWIALELHQETSRLYGDLQELVMKVRLVPIATLFRPHHRTLRDLAAGHGKQAVLVTQGEDVEVDMKVIEQLRDPLLHMVRNAVDHGIEPPQVRRAAGKDPCGHVTLRAYHETGTVVVDVEDDGAGLSCERILARARERGLVGKGDTLPEADLLRLIFEPGFSTAAEVTELSGRGVGMDVVKRNVDLLRGSLSVDSRPGQGTKITLRVPLTLSIIQGFQVAVAGETYVVPLDCVVECLALPAEETARQQRQGVINVRGKPVPYLRLRHHLELDAAEAPPPREHVILLAAGGAQAGLAVDELLGESQTVVKPLAKVFSRVPGLFGSAILGNGRVALILDVPGLLKEVLAAKERA